MSSGDAPKTIGSCAKCGAEILTTHEHSGCIACGERLPGYIRDRIPTLQALVSPVPVAATVEVDPRLAGISIRGVARVIDLAVFYPITFVSILVAVVMVANQLEPSVSPERVRAAIDGSWLGNVLMGAGGGIAHAQRGRWRRKRW